MAQQKDLLLQFYRRLRGKRLIVRTVDCGGGNDDEMAETFSGVLSRVEYVDFCGDSMSVGKLWLYFTDATKSYSEDNERMIYACQVDSVRLAK